MELDYKIQLRLTEDEGQELQRMSEASGISINDILRNFVQQGVNAAKRRVERKQAGGVR